MSTVPKYHGSATLPANNDKLVWKWTCLAFLGSDEDPVEVGKDDGGAEPLELRHQLQQQLLHQLEQGSTQGRVVQQALRAPQPTVEVDYLVEIRGDVCSTPLRAFVNYSVKTLLQPVSNYILLGRFLCELCEFKKASKGHKIYLQSKELYCKVQIDVDPDTD